MPDEKIIVIDINLSRGLVALLVLALLMVAFVGYLAWGQDEATASGPQAPLVSPRLRSPPRPGSGTRARVSAPQVEAGQAARSRSLAAFTGMRQYYLTKTPYQGADADGTDGNGADVCASGYHFASLWEILDPSNLKYNADLGHSRADSGQGPPSAISGWVRTGYGSYYYEGWGKANCNAWTISELWYFGMVAELPDGWAGPPDFQAWNVEPAMCNVTNRVWCVED